MALLLGERPKAMSGKTFVYLPRVVINLDSSSELQALPISYCLHLGGNWTWNFSRAFATLFDKPNPKALLNYCS